MQSPTRVANFNCQLDLESLRRCTPELVCEGVSREPSLRRKDPPQLWVLPSHGLGWWVVFTSLCFLTVTTAPAPAPSWTMPSSCEPHPSSCQVTLSHVCHSNDKRSYYTYYQGLPMPFKTPGQLPAFSQRHGLVSWQGGHMCLWYQRTADGIAPPTLLWTFWWEHPRGRHFENCIPLPWTGTKKNI